MPKIQHEGPRTGEHVLSEARGARSREQGVLAEGKHVAGTVLALNATGDYVAVKPGADDGTGEAKAVLYATTDATEAPQPITVHVRACEVHGAALTWPEGADEAAIAAGTNDLVTRGVIVRD
ncbi:head decoration protein [Halomonas sp. HMF6819]|uniref:head decoration protein n=1 Tax=Halomonas sp. HMF6819 TaxID=3373085 RepID=UPI0037BC60A9